MGNPNTTRDLNSTQAKALLIPTEYVARTLPECEKSLCMLDMKQVLASVIQICTDQEPIENPLAYALLFNDFHDSITWYGTGEYNEKGIFHAHFAFLTNQRIDAFKRSLLTVQQRVFNYDNWTNMFGNLCTLDCIKLQKASRPSSITKYFTKNPLWIISNHDKYLQTMYDIDIWGLNEKWKTPQKPPTDPEMNELTKLLIDIITEHNCKTFNDCLKAAPEKMSKFLHRPSLQGIVANCLEFVKATGGGWKIQNFQHLPTEPDIIHKILLHQGIPPCTFDQAFFTWVTKSEPKKNTFIIQGPTNTGKSQFISGFKGIVPWGEIVNAPVFAWEGLLEAQIGIWEEPCMGPEQAEKFKQVAEGMTTNIPVKHKKPVMLQRIPILITTNHNIWRYCQQEEPMIKNRSWIFYFNYEVKDKYYTPRTCEYGCECRNCTASCGRQTPDGEPSLSTVQRANKPLPTGEQSLWSTQERDVPTRPMCDPGEGTSGSNRSSYTSHSSCTEIRTTDTTESTSNTSTNINRHMEHIRHDRDSTRDRIYHTESRQSNVMESNNNTRSDGNASNTARETESREHIHRLSPRRDGENILPNVQLHTLETTQTREKETTIPIHTKKRRMDRKISTTKIKIPLHIPTPDDWKMYLSYLQNKYG